MTSAEKVLLQRIHGVKQEPQQRLAVLRLLFFSDQLKEDLFESEMKQSGSFWGRRKKKLELIKLGTQ